MFGRTICTAALAALVFAAAVAQEPTFRVTVDTVPLHVSVKDKKGRPIRGLTPADFRVLEDGILQQIVSFREVEIAASQEPASATVRAELNRPGGMPRTPTRPAPASQRRYIVLRFDPLQSPRSLQRAQEAALQVLAELNPVTDYTAVSWRNSVSEFTQDRARLAELVQEIRPDLFALSMNLGQAADPAAIPFAPTGGAGLQDDLSQMFPETPTLDMLDTVIDETVTIGARAPFLSVVGSLKYLQGRKICFYFGQGLSLPRADDRDKRRYDPEYTSRLFSDAGFTVFALNPLGLRAAASASLPNTGPNRGGGSMRARSEATFRMPGASGMGDIYLRRWAENTGGFAFYNNNNLKKGVHRVFEYSRHYYVVAYRSSNADYDARFRRIKVELVNRKAKLAYRNGYFATAPAASELRTRTLLTAMMNPNAFHDFPLEVTWQRTAPDNLQLELLFPFRDIPLQKQEVITPRKKKEERYLQEILVAALVLDRKGEPLGALQEAFKLELMEDQVAAMRQQNATLTRVLQLSPGEPVEIKVAAIVGQNVQLSARSIRLN